MLLQAALSITSQNITHDYEIIIIDDASPDKETKEILGCLENDYNISIIKLTKNFGVQNARNIGISIAMYKYIFMMDADDMLNTNKDIIDKYSYMDRAISVLDRSPDIAFVHSSSLMVGKKNELRNLFALTEKLIIQKHRVAIGLVYRKSDVTRESPYSKSIEKWQDWSFVIGLMNHRKLLNKENNIFYFEEPYYLYRIHDSPDRISTKKICEKEMIKRTLDLYPEIFKTNFPNKSHNEIINFLLISSQDIRGFKPQACLDCNAPNSYCTRKPA